MGARAQSYALNNDAPTAQRILGCLSLMLDEFSIGRLVQAGVPLGARCLEVGAGNGSVACWLAERVGWLGAVVATDVKPHLIRHHPGVSIVRHDIASDDLPVGPFDLVHVRLLLSYLPSRVQVLQRLVDVLRPGGFLLVEDFGYAGRSDVLTGGDRASVEIYGEFQAALAEVYAGSGADTGWALDAYEAMRSAGLADVDTVTHARSWRGGTAGCALPLALSVELREQLMAVGMVGRELDRLAEVLMDPGVVVMGDLLWSHLGRRPVGPGCLATAPVPAAAPPERRSAGQSGVSWVYQAAYVSEVAR